MERRDVLGDEVDIAIVDQLLTRVDAQLHSVRPFSTSPAYRRLVRGFATHEALLAGTRVRLVHSKLRRQNRRLGEVPWGFKVGNDGLTLVPDEKERRVLAIIRIARAEGFKLREIADLLASKGIAGRTGKPIGITRIHELLQLDLETKTSKPKSTK